MCIRFACHMCVSSHVLSTAAHISAKIVCNPNIFLPCRLRKESVLDTCLAFPCLAFVFLGGFFRAGSIYSNMKCKLYKKGMCYAPPLRRVHEVWEERVEHRDWQPFDEDVEAKFATLGELSLHWYIWRSMMRRLCRTRWDSHLAVFMALCIALISKERTYSQLLISLYIQDFSHSIRTSTNFSTSIVDGRPFKPVWRIRLNYCLYYMLSYYRFEFYWHYLRWMDPPQK